MKLWKHTLVTAMAFIGISSAVFYSSCEKDSCADLQCKNGGTCAEGFCRCPSGYEGTVCETAVATKFIGTFYGHNNCQITYPMVDTVDVWLEQSPDRVKFVQHSVIADTLSGTVSGSDLIFTPTTSGNFYKYTNANIVDNKIMVFSQESQNNSNTNVCSFTGFK
jgi:hypothetical protein